MKPEKHTAKAGGCGGLFVSREGVKGELFCDKMGGFGNRRYGGNFKENWDFSVFFLILGANPCFWVNNGGWCVNLRSLGNIGRENASKNEHKLA